MKLSPLTLDIFAGVRSSVRSIKMFNPVDRRPNFKSPLTFEVNYYVMGKPPLENGGHGRDIVIQECTDIINLSFLDLEPESVNQILDFMYDLKKLFEEKICEHLGVPSEQEQGVDRVHTTESSEIISP